MAIGRIPNNTVLDSNGNPISGAVVRFYEVGTVTPKNIYSDQAQSILIGNYITTDSSGRFTTPYLNNPYKIRVEQSLTDSTVLYEEDHIGQDIADVDTQTEGLLTISNVQDSIGTFATTGGSANAYTLTPSQAITSYKSGQFFKFKANHENTGASTINVSGVGVVDLQSNTGADLNSGDIVQDGVYGIIYDGTGFKLINSQGLINSGNTTIENASNPYLEFYSSSGDTDRNRMRLSLTDSQMEFQIRNSGGTLVSNDYHMDFVDTGATFHEWKVAGISRLQIDSSKVSVINAVHVDTINERTSGSGVTIDGTLIKDGKVADSLLLDSQNGSYYRSASNINAGTLNDDRLPSTITKNLTGTIQGVASSNFWHSGNDGASSGLDSDLLDGQHGSYYRSASNINAGTLNNDRLSSSVAIQQTGTYTPSITNLSGGTIPINAVGRAEYIKIGDICIVNVALSMGNSPSDDEVRMTLPFDAENLQLLGECWLLISDTTYSNLSDADDFLTTDGVAQSTLNHGSGIVRGGYFYFKTGVYGSIGSFAIDQDWLYVSFRYRTN